jgi:hypothetical protein
MDYFPTGSYLFFSTRSLRWFVLTAVVGLATLPPLVAPGVRAQTPAVKFDVQAAKGGAVSPVYEGWYAVDGRKYALFGYSNRSLEEVVDIAIGPDNSVAPGPHDQGQPTRFFPGVHYGVFAAALPNNAPPTEVTWTLRANGRTLSIPVNLDAVYMISPQRETGTAYPGNTPPVVKFEPTGDSAQGPKGIVVNRTATVAGPLTLDVWVTDDGLPSGDRGVTGRYRGLVVVWQVYRGTGAARFSNARPPLEQGRARTTVSFSEPGSYTLHVQAVDTMSINRCCWTNGYVTVTVQGAGQRR